VCDVAENISRWVALDEAVAATAAAVADDDNAWRNHFISRSTFSR